MSQRTRGARERALRVNAEAGGAPKRKPPPKKEPTPEELIINFIGKHPGSTIAEIGRGIGGRACAEIVAKLAEGTKIRRDGRGWSLQPPFRFLVPRATPVRNLAAQRGDVIQIGKRLVVVTQVEWRGEAWAVEHVDLVDRGRALTNANPTITWFLPSAAPEPCGRWLGNLEPGSTGLLEKDEASVESGSLAEPVNNRTTREATMATVVRRNTAAKPKAKAKAKPKPAASTETTEATTTPRKANVDYAGRVQEFVDHLQAGKTMRELKQILGVSADTGIREAMYRAGYDSKGNEHGVEEGDKSGLSPAKLRDFLVKERSEGAAWYVLSYRSGKPESEVKAIVSEAGGTTQRVYTRTEKEAKAASNGDGETTAKPAAKPRAGSGKKTVKRAAKANPSK
jgi:hypothetical protein